MYLPKSNILYYEMQVGYTGDPYVGCVDLDECAYSDLNTCDGGLNPKGIDVDVYHDGNQYGPYYLGAVGSDGYSQVKRKKK